MRANMHVKRENDTTILTLEGDVSYGNIESIREEIDRYLDESLKGIIIDLSRATYLDSMGLSLLMRCHAHMVRVGGKCVFAGLSGNVKRVFEIMKLQSVLNTVPTVEEAKEALK